MTVADSLKTYRAKRDFARTAEPSGQAHGPARGHRYLIQKHDATRLHFDLRLGIGGVLVSWAVPNGPSYDPRDKRLAVHVEDHPLDYGDFEGTIPKGEYGGGTVMLWDDGTWEPVGDAEAGFAKGDFKFILHGQRLRGKWVLVRMKPKRGERSKRENWLLIKEKDAYATEESKPIIERVLTSVRSGRTMAEIAEGHVEWKDAGFAIKKGRKAPVAALARPPKFVAPQLATLAEIPPTGDDWLHEIKYDGYRVIAAIGGGEAAVYTRRGLDWTDRFRQLVRPLIDLPCRSALVDGEVAVTDKAGRTDFGALQVALGEGSGAGMGYYLFDLLSFNGTDMRRLPLTDRKQRLAELLQDQPRNGPLFYSDHVVGHGDDMLARVCAMGLEGIISKRAGSTYRSGRGKSWLKAKCAWGQEFVIIGWRPSDVKGRPFSSILLAVREGGELTYRGRVGSGFGERELDGLWPELKKREVKTPPAADVPADVRRKAHFVKPEIVAEIAFRGFTDEGSIRHGSFKGLRKDKAPALVVEEKPPKKAKRKIDKPKTARKGSAVVAIDDARDDKAVEIAGVRVTHPDKIVFPGQGITKRSLAAYFLNVAGHILPQVANRPLSLVRCPDGADGDCFFQKHASPGFPKAFKPIRIKEKRGSDIYLFIEDVQGLIACVQMGALELHIWGSHNDNLEMPDRIVFDLDPDEDMDFTIVRKAARDMRDRLSALGLESFPLATGGKGVHVVAPLVPRYGWEEVKVFAEAVARIIAAEEPDKYLAVATKAKRTGRIFIDYLRNGRGATAIAPFSTRARSGAPVAWPLSWGALARLKDARPASVETAAGLLKRQKQDPWASYFDVEQVLPLNRLGG
ncbi:MAG: DNA ligase D [Hyphomicrobiales bacterium]|nr:DNA ligase D [Hyphomicrobiales bacterium]